MRWLALGSLLLVANGCAASRLRDADASMEADAPTEIDRSVDRFFQATCRAWASCPTGFADYAPHAYGHGPAQCMFEWGQPWADEIRADLRNGSVVVDAAELARCTALLETGECPTEQRATTSWFYLRSCDWSDVFGLPAVLGLGELCGVGEAECAEGLVCAPSFGCPHRCVDGRLEGEACDPTRAERCDLPWVCDGGRCARVVAREVREGEYCGAAIEGERVIERRCAAGLYCQRTSESCVAIPGAGERCPDGVCAPSSFCRFEPSGDHVCVGGPRAEGEPCSGTPETDPCDRPRGLVCAEGRCVRAGRAEGEPCIGFCDEGLACAWDAQRCTPVSPPERFSRADGATCEWSGQCASRWCDWRTEPSVCRPSDTPCE